MEKRQPYPTDLTEEQWNRVAPLIPPVKTGGRPARYERREIKSAIFYQMRGGAAWRMLPHDLPLGQSPITISASGERTGVGSEFTINCEET